MYAIMIWNDLEGDFIYYLKDGKKVAHQGWAEANAEAFAIGVETKQQTKVQFVRDTKGPKKTNRSGRIQRFPAVEWGGEWVAITKTFNSNGKRVKA